MGGDILGRPRKDRSANLPGCILLSHLSFPNTVDYYRVAIGQASSEHTSGINGRCMATRLCDVWPKRHIPPTSSHKGPFDHFLPSARLTRAFLYPCASTSPSPSSPATPRWGTPCGLIVHAHHANLPLAFTAGDHDALRTSASKIRGSPREGSKTR